MIYTPVGVRCRECANIKTLPTYSVSSPYYARALASGLAFTVVVGLLWGLFPSFGFWLALIMGFGVGEIIGWATNQKRGQGLAATAGFCVLAGLAVGQFFVFSQAHHFNLNIVSIAFMGLAFLIAIIRFR
jgi:hypothetical protein